MTYDDLAMTLLDALGLSDQPVTELTLNFKVGHIPRVSVTLGVDLLDADTNTKLHGFHESLRHFELTPITGPDEEEQ